jgi:hypothetical protein
VPAAPSARGTGSPGLPHDTIRRQLALLPLYLTAAFLAAQLVTLLAHPGPRDAAGYVKGHDFAHFYTLGTVARSGAPSHLYDVRALTETMWRVVPAARPDAFVPVYGPQVALAFAPLAALPYASAVWTWLAIVVACYVAASAIVVARVPGLATRRTILWILLLGSPALNVLLVAGQTSAVALLAVACAWWAIDRNRPVLAGACLGVLAYKPSVAAGALATLALAREWRMVGGMLGVAAAQVAVGAAWAGSPVIGQYIAALGPAVLRAGMDVSQPQHLHSLAGFWRLLLGEGRPATLLYAASALGVCLVAARAWRRSRRPGERIALVAVATVLAAPHLYVYDLVLLVPALAVLWEQGERAAGSRSVLYRTAAWVGWLAPLTGPLALATRVQWATPVIVVALILLSGAARADIRDRPETTTP